MAAAASVDLGVDVDRWRAQFDDLVARIAPRFARVEPRRHARELLLGLIAELPRVNCWTLAEHAGHSSPDALQRLLARATWDADNVPELPGRAAWDSARVRSARRRCLDGEIGRLLRHAQQRTNALYAKVDRTRLAGLARPCSQPVAR